VIYLSSHESSAPRSNVRQLPSPANTDVERTGSDEEDHAYFNISCVSCCICNSPNQVHSFFGLMCCKSCSLFYKRAEKHGFDYSCPRKGTCRVEWRQGVSIDCSGCRLHKILSHPEFRYEEIEKLPKAELEPVLSSLDMPFADPNNKLDMSGKFSRWFYADPIAFMSNSFRTKKPSDEVKPKCNPNLTLFGFNNHLDDLQFAYLTSQLESEQESPPDIGELITPVMDIKPSVGLVNQHNANSENLDKVTSRELLSQSGETGTDPLLNFELRTLRTVIDRGPMLKRLRRATSDTTRKDAEIATSMIEPGEDCDDGDDPVIIEIDCDKL
jgi:hypothetical protein